MTRLDPRFPMQLWLGDLAWCQCLNWVTYVIFHDFYGSGCFASYESYTSQPLAIFSPSIFIFSSSHFQWCNGHWNNSLTLIGSLKFENLELIEIWTLQSSIGWIWVAGRIGFHPRSSTPCLRETSKDEARDQCNTISDLFVSLLIDAWIHELMMIRLLLTYGVLVMSW